MITLVQDCVIKEIKKDGYGKMSVVKETPCKCRAKEKFQLVLNQAAEKVTSEIEFTVPNEMNVNVGFQIEYEGKSYTILSLKQTRNTLGEVVLKAVYV
jgi:hypothetical protein